MRALAAALLVLAGCSEEQTGVVVTVAGAVAVDQLLVTASLGAGTTSTVSIPSSPATLTLPTTFFAQLPDDAKTVQFTIVASAGGTTVARGASSIITVAPHASASTTVKLVEAHVLPLDGGTMPEKGDATMNGAGPDMPTSTGCLPNRATACDGNEIVCDGFETSSSVTYPEWTNAEVASVNGSQNGPNAGTALEVVTGERCDGTNALHASAVGANQAALLYKDGLTFPTNVFVRAFIYVPSTTSITGTTALIGLSAQNQAHALSIGYEAGGNFTVFTSYGTSKTFAGTLPAATWVCLSSAIKLDPAQGSIQVGLDGTSLGTATAITTQSNGQPMTTFSVGAITLSGNADIYFDDVAISSSPLDCN